MCGDALDLRVRRLPRLHAVAAAPLDKGSRVTDAPRTRPERRTLLTVPHNYGEQNLSTGEGGGDYHLHSPAAAFCFAVV